MIGSSNPPISDQISLNRHSPDSGGLDRKTAWISHFRQARTLLAAFADGWSGPWRSASAEARLRKVLKLGPNDASARCALGVLRMYTNRVAQGIAECERAFAID
jgi:hypothetical protein